jgi:CRISPR-associated protein Csy2
MRLTPGFALVSRHDMLAKRLGDLSADNPDATILDAWLDLSRLNWRSEREEREDGSLEIGWHMVRRKKGWLVPIPVGYAALSPLYEPGEVKNARDAGTRFRFVESLYSLGEWKGVHRLATANELLWRTEYDEENGLYLCRQ